MGFTFSAKESRMRAYVPFIFKCRSSINPNFQSMLLFFFLFCLFFLLSATIYIFKYQLGLKITSEEGLGSYQEPRITLSILLRLQTSSIPFHHLSALGTDSPETDLFLTLPSSFSTGANIRTGCFVPDSIVTNNHVTAILKTILQNIDDQATAHNSWTHTMSLVSISILFQNQSLKTPVNYLLHLFYTSSFIAYSIRRETEVGHSNV